MTAGFVVGILVSVFEFACTGQIYLPTIIYMLKLPGYRFSALGYLLLYNLMFIVPLIIIFMLAWKGVTSEQFAGIMYKHLSKIKMGMAIFFFGMGLLLIIS
jgi:cytochrome c biogenesis protein CcdA